MIVTYLHIEAQALHMLVKICRCHAAGRAMLEAKPDTTIPPVKEVVFNTRLGVAGIK